MTGYTTKEFANTVLGDYTRRRDSLQATLSHGSSELRKAEALGHPRFDGLKVGGRETAPMVMVFLDLTDFTGRTFWDPQEQVVDLAHAVLAGFIETVTAYGGYALGLRGDGLFAGFGPGNPQVDSSFALGACALALAGIRDEVNPRLDALGIRRLQARAGLDFGDITFVRTGTDENSEINPIGFAANFAAKCEKRANSWEVLVGEGLTDLLPASELFIEHEKSPKEYTRDHETKVYRFFNYRWKTALSHLPDAAAQLDGNPTSSIAIH